MSCVYVNKNITNISFHVKVRIELIEIPLFLFFTEYMDIG